MKKTEFQINVTPFESTVICHALAQLKCQLCPFDLPCKKVEIANDAFCHSIETKLEGGWNAYLVKEKENEDFCPYCGARRNEDDDGET